MVVAAGISLTEPVIPVAPKFDEITEVASVEDQLSLALCPAAMVVGEAVRVTVGGGDGDDPPPDPLTVTVVEAVACPPAPLTVRV